MKRVIYFFDSRFSIIERAVAILAGALIIVMMFLVCAEVVGRTLFNETIHGIIDIIELLMVALVTLGIAYGQGKFANVRMTLLTRKLTGRGKWFGEVFSHGVAFYVAAVLTVGSWWNLSRAWKNGGDTPDLGIPIWPAIAVVTFALALLSVRLLIQLVEAIRLMASNSDDSEIYTKAAETAENTPTE